MTGLSYSPALNPHTGSSRQGLVNGSEYSPLKFIRGGSGKVGLVALCSNHPHNHNHASHMSPEPIHCLPKGLARILSSPTG